MPLVLHQSCSTALLYILAKSQGFDGVQNGADARSKSDASALSRARAWVETRGCGWLGLVAAGAAAFLGTNLLMRAAGAAVGGAALGESP
jgi:hypothetical protein